MVKFVKILFKRLLKISAWIIACVILLFLCLYLLINIPAVQQKLLSETTSWLRNKTKTDIRVQKIDLRIPKSVVLEGLFVKDLSSDTLVNTGELAVEINVTDLFRKQITLNSVRLSNATVRLRRSANDSVYNFDFLVKAFASPSAKKDSLAKQDNLDVNDLKLQNVDFLLDDEKSGLYTRYRVARLDVEMKKLGINENDFRAKSIEIDGLRGELVQYKRSLPNDSSTKKNNRLPFASSALIKIKNSFFVYEDKTAKQYIQASINDLELTEGEVNLQKQTVKANTFKLENSFGRVGLTFQAKESNESVPAKAQEKIDQGWSVTVNKISLSKNNLGYNVLNAAPKSNSFDANHINYAELSLVAGNFFYSSEKLQADVESFSAIDPRSFNVKNFSASFLMTPTLIEGKNILLRTTESSFSGDGRITFYNLSSIADSLAQLGIYTKIKSAEASATELAWFAPTLTNVPVFHRGNRLRASGLLTGKLNHIKTPGFTVYAGKTSRVYTRGEVRGLPDPKALFLDLKQIEAHTSKEDLQALTGRLPTDNINIPANVNLNGTFKGTLKRFSSSAHVQSDFGMIDAAATIDQEENFSAHIITEKFELGRLLNSELFGASTLSANIWGSGLDTQRISANVNLASKEFTINKYTYRNITLNGNYTKQTITAELAVQDTNLALKANGFVNLNKGSEQYKTDLKLEGADLKKINLSDRDMRIAFDAISDIKGADMNSINGKAGVTKIMVASSGKKYILDSLLFAAINEGGNSEMNLTSSIIGINYKGTFAPGDLIKEMKQNFHSYFAIEDAPAAQPLKGPQQFSFDITFNNHPVLQEVFFPGLLEFDPGTISGSYRSDSKKLELNGEIKRLIYKTFDIRGFLAQISSDEKKLTFNFKSDKLSNSKIKFDNVELKGGFENQAGYATLSSTGTADERKIRLSTSLTHHEKSGYKLRLEPSELILMNEPWTVSDDNYIIFANDGMLFHNLLLAKNGSSLTVNTPSDKIGGDAHVSLTNFRLDNISKIIEKDTSLVKGIANGSIILKKTNQTYPFEADLGIKNLAMREVEVGNLDIKANNIVTGKYDLSVNLTGAGNSISAKGFYTPGKASELDVSLTMSPLTARSLEAFSFGQIRQASGNLSGNLIVKGKVNDPSITGQLVFNDVQLTPSYLNSPLYLKSETISLQPGNLAFNAFTILDVNNNPAVVNGSISMKELKDFKFALTINTTDFMLFNTTRRDNEQFFGTMIIDSRLRVRGTLDYPVISSTVKLKKGSYFTFAAIENKLSADRGENIVVFEDSTKLNPILRREGTKQRSVSTLKNFDISSTVEIDRKATIRLMLDPGTNDSLVVRGEAALSFGLDPSGKMSLTGVYNLSEGTYVVSLENVIKKKFKISPGSTITWNGDPLDALVNLNATYFTRTTPVDLVAGQVTNAELANYRQRYGFDVILKLRGPILTPDISFEIQLEQGQKGAIGGTINGKLEQLNDNPSALNKQVFALLVLNRFIQENPLETETNAGENAARTTVGKFLSAQLNQLSSRFVPGVDINFDVQSYNDYSTGKSEGRTQVGVGVTKQLFDERLSVQVGGAVDVEGEKAKQNTATDITGDVIVEYKLTKNGRYRLKGFRNSQYQGALEGQIIQTGAGILYVRDFNEWMQLFRKETNQTEEEDLNAQAWDTK